MSSLPRVLGLLPSNPQVSAVQSRRSLDKTLFVRAQVAIYFVSLLICNLVQAIGGLLSTAWLVEGGVYVGVACTAQAVSLQIGNVWKFLSFAEKSEHSLLLWSQIGLYL